MRSDVEFGTQLAQALAFGDSPSEVANVEPTVSVESSTSMRVDGNDVEVDRESTNLAETQPQYQALMAVVTPSDRRHGCAARLAGG